VSGGVIRAFLALLVPYIFSIFFRSFLTVIALDLTRDLGIGPRDFAALGSIWFLVFALAQFPVGYALDRVGPRRTIAVLMAIGFAGAVLFSQATSFAVALLGMSLIGLGCSPIFMGSLVLFARLLPGERFGFVTSLFIGLGSAGNLVSASPLARAVEAYGWRPSMLAIALAFGLSGLAAAFFLRDPPALAGTGGKPDHGPGLWQGLVQMAKIGPLWLIMPLVFVSYAILATERGLWLGPFLGDVHGFKQVEQGDAAFLMAIAMTAGALAYGPLSRLIADEQRTVMVGSGAVVLLFAALSLFGHVSPQWGVALLCLIGLAGFNYGILMAHARWFFPANLTGRGMTFVNFAFIAGSAVIQIASGSFIQAARAAGWGSEAIYAWLHGGFAGITALALVIYVFAPKHPTRP
jgi:predicted MFS family arabinose efflux permease